MFVAPCTHCGDIIYAYEYILKAEDGGMYHKDCAEKLTGIFSDVKDLVFLNFSEQILKRESDGDTNS